MDVLLSGDPSCGDHQTAVFLVVGIAVIIGGNDEGTARPRLGAHCLPHIKHAACIDIVKGGGKKHREGEIFGCTAGIGTALLNELIAAARAHGTEILELDFIEGNTRAQRLYEKMGFAIVGFKRNAFKLKDGTYLGEFSMQKHL